MLSKNNTKPTSHVRNGQKSRLPTDTLIKIAEILIFFQQKQIVSKEENELLDKQQSKMQEIIKHQAIELKYKQMKEQRALDKIEK